MKRLIIPDVHNQITKVKTIVEREKPDVIYALGDWFDSWGDTPKHAEATALFLREIRNDSRWRKCWGNHDISYAFPRNLYASCSGYTDAKRKVIHGILEQEDWQQFKWFHEMDGWLLTHAGLDFRQCITQDIYDGKIAQYLEKECERADFKIQRFDTHWVYGAGRCRGGSREVGGLVWCDFNEEFMPIKSIRQIFGHTPQSEPMWMNSENTIPASRYQYGGGDWNLALDTHLKHYAVWDGTKMEIKPV